jgi:hypothetical protein
MSKRTASRSAVSGSDAVRTRRPSNRSIIRSLLLALFGIVGFLGLLNGTTARTTAESPPPGKDKAVTLDTDPHLVGWWKFDEASGKTTADSSGHDRSGALEGGASFETLSAPGRIGKAIKLDGKDQCVRVAGFKGVTGTQARTISAWVKTTTPGGQIVSWGIDDFGKMWMLSFIRGRVGVTPKGGYFYMKAGVHDDAWHHVAAVVRGASPPNLHDDVKLYRDGEVAEIDDIGLLDCWPIETGDKLDVTIGRRYKGLIDDLRVYDRALTDDEIKALFSLQSDRPLPKP